MFRLKKSIVVAMAVVLLGSLFVPSAAQALSMGHVESFKAAYNSKNNELFVVFEYDDYWGEQSGLIGMRFNMDGKPIGEPVTYHHDRVSNSYDLVYNDNANRYLLAWTDWADWETFKVETRILDGDQPADIVHSGSSCTGFDNQCSGPSIAYLPREGDEGVFGLAYSMNTDDGEQLMFQLLDKDGYGLSQPIHAFSDGADFEEVNIVHDPMADGFFVAWTEYQDGARLYGKHVRYAMQAGDPMLTFDHEAAFLGRFGSNWNVDLAASPSGVGVVWESRNEEELKGLSVAKVVYGDTIETRYLEQTSEYMGQQSSISHHVALIYDPNGGNEGYFALAWDVSVGETYPTTYRAKLTEDDLSLIDSFEPSLPAQQLLYAAGKVKAVVQTPTGMWLLDFFGDWGDLEPAYNFYEPVISRDDSGDYLVVSHDAYWTLEDNEQQVLQAHWMDAAGVVKSSLVLEESLHKSYASAYGDGKHLVVWTNGANGNLQGAYLRADDPTSFETVTFNGLPTKYIHKFALAPLTDGKFLLVYYDHVNYKIHADVIADGEIESAGQNQLAIDETLPHIDNHPFVLAPVGSSDHWLLVWQDNSWVHAQFFAFDEDQGVQVTGETQSSFYSNVNDVRRVRVAHDPQRNVMVIGTVAGENLSLKTVEYDEVDHSSRTLKSAGFNFPQDDGLGERDMELFYDPVSQEVQVLWTENSDGKPVILQQSLSNWGRDPDIQWQMDTGFWDSFVRMSGVRDNDRFTLFYSAYEEMSDTTAVYGLLPMTSVESVLRTMDQNPENRIHIQHLVQFMLREDYAHMIVEPDKLLPYIEPIHPRYMAP